MTPYIYIYSRVSSNKQLDGAGLDTQTKSIQTKLPKLQHETGLEVHSTRLIDSGVSAFKGSNILEGSDLGDFINKIESGVVARGSVLAMFSLDRLSRLPTERAQEILLRVINSGISIYTSINDSLIQAGSNDIIHQLIVTVIEFSRSHSESKTKSARTRDSAKYAIERFRKGERSPEGFPYAIKSVGRNPFYISPIGEGKQATIQPNEFYPIARDITKRMLRGDGVYSILKWLNSTHAPPASFKNKWSQSALKRWHLNDYITGTKVINLGTGEYDNDGIEITKEHILKNYYPALCTENEQLKLKVIRSSRAATDTSAKTYTPLLTGMKILRCYQCGCTLTILKHRNKLRLMCIGGQQQTSDCKAWTIDNESVERVVVKASMARIWNHQNSAKEVKDFTLEESILQAEQDRLDNIRQAILQSGDTGLISGLTENQKELDEKKKALEQEKLRVTKTSLDSISADFKGINTNVFTPTESDQRLKLAASLKGVIDTIYVDPLQEKLAFNIDIRFKDGKIIELTHKKDFVSITRCNLDSTLDKEFLNKWGADKPWIDELFDDEPEQDK